MVYKVASQLIIHEDELMLMYLCADLEHLLRWPVHHPAHGLLLHVHGPHLQ